MRLVAVQPQTLADDLHLLCTVPNHLEFLENGFAKNHQHLDDIVAPIVENKTVTYPDASLPR